MIWMFPCTLNCISSCFSTFCLHCKRGLAMKWHQRRRSTWVSAIHGNCQQFMAIHQFSVSRNSQATKSTRNRRIFQCCVRIPVVNIVDIFAACESQIVIPHTTLGTFNLLCLSKDWHRTELTRLRKQSEMQVREGVWCVLECYTVESEQIRGFCPVCLVDVLPEVILKPPHAYYDEYCSGFVRPNPKQQTLGQNYGALGTKNGMFS